MALKPLNSVGGFSVGETSNTVIASNTYITSNGANFSGNLMISNATASWGILTDNLYYSNGLPWDLQLPGGSNTQIQFNDDDQFGGSANFTFNKSTNVLTVTGNANITNTAIVGNLRTDNLLYANGNPWDLQEAAGANTQLQYNDGSNNFGASANLTFDYSTNVLKITGNANVTNTAIVGNLRTDNLLYANGNPWDLQEAAGSNNEIQYNIDDNFAASANFTYNDSTQLFTVLGNSQFNNANLGNLARANYVNVASSVVTSNLTVNLELGGNTANFSGNVVSNNLTVNLELAGNTANFTGNIKTLNANLGNLATANYVNVASNLISNNLTVNLDLSGNTANFTGNITSLNANLGNLATANYVNVAQQVNGNVANFTGNLTAANASLGNLVTANYVNVASNVTSNNVTVNLELSGNTANFSGNVQVNNLDVNLELSGNTANFTGNIVAANIIGDLANGNSNIRIYNNANVEISITGTANTMSFSATGLYVDGEINTTAGNMLSNGNVTANGFLNGANANVTGQILAGSVTTANINAPTGNITISAAGTNENIILNPTGLGTVDTGLHRVTSVGTPSDPFDAATKEYVDNIAQGLSVHPAVKVTSTTNLNGTYADGGTTLTTTTISGGKTITFGANHGLSVGDEIYWVNTFNGITAYNAYFVYSTPALNQITVKDGFYGAEVTTLTNGTGLTETANANSGVGATLTNAGANVALSIDTVSLSVNDRVLVQGQTNAEENGVYIVTTVGAPDVPGPGAQWVLTRSTDTNNYDPKSLTGLAYGDYFFVQQGTNSAGSSYILTTPAGEIVFGYTNIGFTQFSAAGAYTAGSGIDINGTIISANVDGVTTDIVAGNIVVKSSANLTTPNIGDATFSSLTWNNLSNGNVTANNLSVSNIANITGDVTLGANLQVNGFIASNANVSGANLTTTGVVSASGNITGANVTANATLTAGNANVSGTTTTSNLTVNLALSGNTANFSGNVEVNNFDVNLEFTGNTANFTGNVQVNNFDVNLEFTGNTANFTGNVTLPNLTVNLELAGNTANFTGNIKAANANLGNVVLANYFTGTLINGTSNVAIPSTNGNVNITAGGNTTLVITSTSANITGNIDGSANLNLSSNLFANNVTSNNNVFLGNTAVRWATVTTTAITANQTIATISTTGISGYEFLVKGIDSSGAKYSVATVTAVTDSSTVDYVVYATAALGGQTGTFAVNVVGGNIELQVTPASTNSTVWTTQYRTI